MCAHNVYDFGDGNKLFFGQFIEHNIEKERECQFDSFEKQK